MNKVILITGASAGIGAETAIRLQKEGNIVYGAARRLDKMEDLKKYGVKVIKIDVSNEESMKKCVTQVFKEQGKIDILINNAGYGSYGAMEDIAMSEAKKQFDVNLFGLARMTQLVLPSMREKRSGTIINVSSIGGKVGSPHGSWYQASKFAVEGFSDSIRMELKQFGIKVVVIEPGAIKTEWSGIAQKHLLATSGNTAYGAFAKRHAASLDKYDNRGSHPRVVAKAISKAVNSHDPKTRYMIGSGATTMKFLKFILSDKMMDRMMLKFLGY